MSEKTYSIDGTFSIGTTRQQAFQNCAKGYLMKERSMYRYKDNPEGSWLITLTRKTKKVSLINDAEVA